MTTARHPIIPPERRENPGQIPVFQAHDSGRAGVIAIGASTGGPRALTEVLSGLARNFKLPIVIVQHMPAQFTPGLARMLTTQTGRFVQEGVPGAALHPGDIWLAPGGVHMEVEGSATEAHLRIHKEAPENFCRPAVDVLFRSVARVFGKSTVGVVLTGMGEDAKQGCQTIRAAGGRVFAQDESSSAVWGMPGTVVRAGLSSMTLPLGRIAPEINRLASAAVHAPYSLAQQPWTTFA